MRGVTVDSEAVTAAYLDVRDDDSETVYALFTYQEDNTKIGVLKTGGDYSEVVTTLEEDGNGTALRAYIYLRVTTGDEMSKRAKFVLLTWCGAGVPVLKKAKMSLEKTEVKKIVESFSVEMQTSDLEDMYLDKITDAVKKSGGANYGTGAAAL